MIGGLSGRGCQSIGKACPGSAKILESEANMDCCPGMDELFGSRVGSLGGKPRREMLFWTIMSLFKRHMGNVG